MADDVNSQLESALETLLNINGEERQPEERPQAGQVDSVSILRNIFVNLKNSEEEQNIKINQLEVELNKAKAELRESGVANLLGRALPSRGSIWQPPTPACKISCHLSAELRNYTLRRLIHVAINNTSYW